MSELWFFLTSIIWVAAIVALIKANRAIKILRLQVKINQGVAIALAALGVSVDALCSPQNLTEEEAQKARLEIERLEVEMKRDLEAVE